MRFAMTSQQMAFFSQNGYIEVAGLPFDPTETFAAVRAAKDTQPFGRDLWRKSDTLQRLLLRKLAPAVFQITGKSTRLGLDQWVPAYTPDKRAAVKELFCVQGLVLCALFVGSEVAPPQRRAAALGISPLPLHPSHVLFVKPNILLDWPLLQKAAADLYLAAYSYANQSVYAHHAQDPATHALKDLGYAFGDTLKDPHHPLLTP
jgi:hypothetical protein